MFEPYVAQWNVANIIQIKRNIYHVDLHFTLRRQEFYLYTLHLLCFSAGEYSEPIQTSKMEFFSVIS